MGQNVCQCTHVVHVLCWWFTQLPGSHPGPIFSSLHNSHQSDWSCALSFFLLLHLFLSHFLSHTFQCKRAPWTQLLPPDTKSDYKVTIRNPLNQQKEVITCFAVVKCAERLGCFFLKSSPELSRAYEVRSIRYTICLQNSTQLGTRVWLAENRVTQSQSWHYRPTSLALHKLNRVTTRRDEAHERKENWCWCK